MSSVMYITGSFPRLGDGIGDAAGKLYDAIEDKSRIKLVTTGDEKIKKYVDECGYKNVKFVSNWKIGTIIKLIRYIKMNNIENVLIEYAGNGYRKDLGISFLPLILRFNNIFSSKTVTCHLRLHEFSMCRPARKVFTYPLIWFSHQIDTPSYVEYNVLTSKIGSKVRKSMIGSNFKWREEDKTSKRKNDKIILAFFGGIYPGKGIEQLLDIWEMIQSRYPEKYEYWLLGGFPQGLTSAFDDYQAHISKLIKEKDLEKNIYISGFLPSDEIEKKLDLIDIAVLPYEDGLTLRRGSFLAFLSRQVAIVTSEGDKEAKEVFQNAVGVKMCSDAEKMIEGILDYSKDDKYVLAGVDNKRFKALFDWKVIAKETIESFK